MNHLGHLFLARDNPRLMTGAFLGDFVKGPLRGQHHPEIERGIKFHRAVDAWVDQHPAQRQSISRFDPKFRRYGGIICDVVYDHFLAIQWDHYSDQALTTFCHEAYEALLGHEPEMGTRAIQTASRMQQFGSLEAYGTTTYIERSLNHIGTRLKRQNPLQEAFAEVRLSYPAMQQDFQAFMPDALEFAEHWLTANAEPRNC